MTTEINYEKQARDFLNKWGIDYFAEWVDTDCPPFCDNKNHIHGHRHQITLKRPLTQDKIKFYFWNSYTDSKENKLPTPYDVLACCSSDIFTPDTFEDFCSDLGYNTDSIKALKTFKLCARQKEKLFKIFNTEEMRNELMEIQ